jgi:capsular exopolysaccharide synthesis family protein
MPELTGTKDLRAYLRMFWRWKWLLLSFVVAVPLIAYVIESGKTNTYQSSSLIGINSATVNSSVTGNAGSFSTSNITAIAELVTTTPVADVAAGLMHPPANPGQVVGEVSANGDPTTNFLTITATDPDPARAAAIANAFARAISLNLQQAAVGQVNAAIKSVRAQLATAKDPATKATLQQQLQQLIAARSTQGGEAAVLQPAVPSSTPTGTSTRRTLELALLIGLLLGIGAVVVAESADRRIRTPEDLETITGLPLLAAIESSAFSGDLTTTSEDDEAFQMLRTSLRYFNIERPLDSVIITSAGEKDGKTTVATRLALAAAGAGLDVVLVDADLRRAGVTNRFGIKAHDGLGAVIVGARSPDEVMVEQPLDQQGAVPLRILPAGNPPPNPSALMSSDGMAEVLKELEQQSDLVIVDSPAALAVSDPLPLMTKVSGVVVVARMNSSSRQTVRRLQKIIESAHGRMLGVVATGTIAGPGYKHYYPTYYSNGTSNGTNGSGKLRRRRHKTPPPVIPAPERPTAGVPEDQ